MSIVELFKELDPEKYYFENNLSTILEVGEEIKEIKNINNRQIRRKDTNRFAPQLLDLTRLHYLTTKLSVLNVLEFGTGYSTSVFCHALRANQRRLSSAFDKDLHRRDEPFRCFTVDSDRKWIRTVQREIRSIDQDLLTYLRIRYSKVRMHMIGARIVTLYDSLPNISPDLIYIDGPDQFHVADSINGISTASIDRMPMSADVLSFEHYLLPGTIIVLDGRAANARFLLCNLERSWKYEYDEASDQHIFLLDEEPLGRYNEEIIEYRKCWDLLGIKTRRLSS